MLAYLMIAFLLKMEGRGEVCLNLGNPDCSIQTSPEWIVSSRQNSPELDVEG